MAKITKENLRKAEENYGNTASFQRLKGIWKRRKVIPDKYLEMQGWNYVGEEKAQGLRRVLCFPEINYCKLVDKQYIFTSVMADIKLGKRAVYEWEYKLIKEELSVLGSKIKHFARKKVQPSVAYFESLNQLLDDDRLVKRTLHQAVAVEVKPMLFKFFPYHRKKYGAYAPKLIQNYRPFFEGLRKELRVLSEKLILE
ncbi:hypothetical protein [Sinomicrobium sp. M5D2P9]